MKPRFCSLLAALAFVQFLEYAEQNRLKTRGFCVAGSVRIMWGGTLHFFEILKTPSRQSTSTQHPNRRSVHQAQNVIGNVIEKPSVLQHFSADHVDHKNTELAAETSSKLLYINKYDDDPEIASKNYNKKYKNLLTNRVQKRIIDNR